MSTQVSTQRLRRFPDAFRELLLLEDAQKVAKSRSSEQQARIRELTEAVDARLSAADSLGARDQVPASLVIHREAAILAIQAILAANPSDSPGDDAATPSDAFLAVDKLIERGVVPASPKGFDRARHVLCETGLLAFDELAPSDALQRRAEVEHAVGWLRSLVDTRTVGQIRFSRIFRIASLALLAIGAIVWLGSRLVSSNNIARGKAVAMSSRRPECPPGSGPQGAPPAGLVDGSKSGGYDVCTNFEVNPWVVVDLGKPYSLSRVKVYNRGDCCWGAHDIPVVLELSQDGAAYATQAQRATAFTDSSPWVVDIPGASARYIRVRSDSPEPRELVLLEVEAFAR